MLMRTGPRAGTRTGVTCVAIAGSGSAGRRHLGAVRAALPDADLVVVRRPQSLRPKSDLIAVGARVVETIGEAVALEPDVGIVAGPATLHRAAAEAFLGAGADVRGACVHPVVWPGAVVYPGERLVDAVRARRPDGTDLTVCSAPPPEAAAGNVASMS